MNVLRERQAAQLTTAAVVAVLVGVVAGCADRETGIVWPEDPSPTQAVPRSDAPDPIEQEVADEIVSLVLDFREAEAASYSDPQPPHVARRKLESYLADPLLSETLDTLDGLHQAGVVFEGRPNWGPTVTELRLNETPQTATVHDCVDATNWRSVFRESGDPVPGDTLPDHYLARMELTLYDGGWRLHDIGIEEDVQC